MAKIEDCPGFETFGADVKAARKAKQLSRSALADMIHCDSRYLANIENEGTLPSLPVVIQQMIQCCFIRPKERPYQTNNAYAALVRQYQMEQEVKAIVQKNDTPRNRKAQKAHPRPEKRN